MTPKIEDTKEKILVAASSLFAKAGFAGASMREIAKNAGVNLAAINYHFQNKERLYWETFVLAITKIEDACSQLDLKQSIDDMTWNMFCIMRLNNSSIINTFKMILADSLPEPSTEYLDFCKSKDVGPPGGRFLAAALKNHVPNASDEGIEWAVKSIFLYIFQLAMTIDSQYVERLRTDSNGLSLKSLEPSVRMHALAILEYLKKGVSPPSVTL